MTDPEDDEEAGAVDSLGMVDGDMVILDKAAFMAAFEAVAVMRRGSDLYYLDGESRKWLDVEQPTAKARRTQ